MNFKKLILLILLHAQIAHADSNSTIVQLFEWPWTDIAAECETFLAKSGYDAVQISPPNEHRMTSKREWYETYQVVSYKLETKRGSRAELSEMIKRCQNVGIQVYADVILNHTTGILAEGEVELGYAGTSFGHYRYGSIYSPFDFHYCSEQPDHNIRNYQNRSEVQYCQLVGLADLKTGSFWVRKQIHNYLDDLKSIGIQGIRIDAAKHIAAHELQQLISEVPNNWSIYSEVIDYGGEPISKHEYSDFGRVTEFSYSAEIENIFRRRSMQNLQNIGSESRFLSSDKALVFIDNHDTQRDGKMSFKEMHLYRLASAFMVLNPYGRPRVMSSFYFDHHSQGPKLDSSGATKKIYSNQTNLGCGKDWVCEHRDPLIVAASWIRKQLLTSQPTGNSLSKWWTGGRDQVGFKLGKHNYVLINRNSEPYSVDQLETGLPEGRYCDLGRSSLEDYKNQACLQIIEVGADSKASFSIGAYQAALLHPLK